MVIFEEGRSYSSLRDVLIRREQCHVKAETQGRSCDDRWKCRHYKPRSGRMDNLGSQQAARKDFIQSVRGRGPADTRSSDFSASRTAREYTSVVLRHPVSGTMLGCPRKLTHTEMTISVVNTETIG